MTREEAIKVLERYEPIEWGDDQDAFDMAKEALSAETHEKRTETHGVCSDLISREAAIKAISTKGCDEREAPLADAMMNVKQWVVDILDSLPSVPCDSCIWDVCNYNKIDWDTEKTTEPVDCTDFIRWIRDRVMDEEDWELNAVAYGEVIARKLKKLNAVFSEGGYYHSAEPIYGEWLHEELIPNTVEGHVHGECSVCHAVRIVDNYCPNCGAKMDGGK